MRSSFGNSKISAIVEQFTDPGIGLPLIPALFVLLFLVVSTIISGLPPTFFSIDPAMLELYTKHATRGVQLLGPYSRFGWNHPGPMFFYMAAPFYIISGQSGVSLFLTAKLISLVSALGIGLMMRKLSNDCGGGAFTISILFLAYILYLGPVLLSSPWNPWVIVLPLGLCSFFAWAFSLGDERYLPAMALVGSFISQTHLAVGICMGALFACACVFFVLNYKAGSRGRFLTAIIFSLLILCIIWAPPFVEAIRGEGGNLGKLYSFFLENPHHPQTVSDVLDAVSVTIAWLPLWVLRALHVHMPEFEAGILAKGVSLVQIALLLYCLARARREGINSLAHFCILLLSCLVACVWSVFGVQGHVFSYLVEWISVFGWLMWIPPLILLEKSLLWGADGPGRARVQAPGGSRLMEASRTRGNVIARTEETKQPELRPIETKWSLKGLKAVSAPALIAILVSGAIPFAEYCFTDPPNSEIVRKLSTDIIGHLKGHADIPLTIDFDWNEWPTHTGVILAMYKEGIPFYVNNLRRKHGADWPLLFEDRVFRPPAKSRRLSIVRVPDTLHSAELISVHDGYFVYLTQQ
jgi:hypothetical protein